MTSDQLQRDFDTYRAIARICCPTEFGEILGKPESDPIAALLIDPTDRCWRKTMDKWHRQLLNDTEDDFENEDFENE